MDTRCAGMKSDGAPCEARAAASGFCRMHDPDPAVAAEVAAARARGNTSAKRTPSAARVRTVTAADLPFGGEPKTLDEAASLASWIAQAILTGKVDARTGREAIQAIQAVKAVIATRDLSAHKLAALKAELLRELRGGQP